MRRRSACERLSQACRRTTVAPNTSCDSANNLQLFEQALAAAESGADADRILLGPDTYMAPTASGYNYSQAYPVEIIGAGTGQTTLTAPPGASMVVTLYGGSDSSIRDLTIRLPQNAAAGAAGLETENTARSIEVTEDPIQIQGNPRSGVNLAESGATLEDSRVTLPSNLTLGVRLGAGGTAVRRSTVSAHTGVQSFGGSVDRSRLIVDNAGLAALARTTTLERSLVRVTGGNGIGIYASAGLAFTSTLNADGVTMIAPGGPDYEGATAFNGLSPDHDVELNLSNSVIRGFEHPLWASASPLGSGQAKIAVSFSDYDPTGNMTTGANGRIDEASVSNVGDARFLDAANGDYRLLPTSPLVDAGDPATIDGADLDDNPLVADGNGDGTARRDLGAFELQPPVTEGDGGGGGSPEPGPQGGTPAGDTVAPLVGRFRAAPALFTVARGGTPIAARVPRGTRFRFMLSEAARVTVKLQRARARRYRTVGALRRSRAQGANRIRFSGRIGKQRLRPGRYRAVIRAVDAAGNRAARRTTRFRVVSG